MNFRSGESVQDRYQLIELIGEGGSGSTYRAVRFHDGGEVAIKILSLRHINDWKKLELFEREAKILAQLNHPQIPKYLEYFQIDTETDRSFCIVQELAPGKPLTEWVKSGWHGTEAEIKDIATQLLEILIYLQQQTPPLIHRDIKPNNIIRDDAGRIFLVDFGAVQDVYQHTLMGGNTVAGTYGYMSPEQFRGRAESASALYGLGATILYLLTHRSPADLPQSRLKLNFRSRVNISERFADWLEGMLEPDLTDRFTSATQALAALNGKYRKSQRGIKTGFPWQGAIAATLIAVTSISIFHQYRYVFLDVVGLKPRDLCNSIANIDNYLAHGGNIETEIDTHSFNSNKGSILHCAIETNRLEIIAYLLNKGANPNALDNFKTTPIYRTVASDLPSPNKSKIISLLVEAKADISRGQTYLHNNNNGIEEDRSPLFEAVHRGELDLAEQLINFGANPNPLLKCKNSSLLIHEFVSSDRRIYRKEDNLEVNKFLDILTYHNLVVGIDSQDKAGNTPLHIIALKNTSPFLLEKFIELKANVNLINKDGATALMITGEPSMVEALLAAGARTNDRDKNGDTALTLVLKNYIYDPTAFQHHPNLIHQQEQLERVMRIVTSLLDRGANPNLANNEGLSALYLLTRPHQSRGMPGMNECIGSAVSEDKILNLLVKYGANLKTIGSRGNTPLHQAAQNGDLLFMKQLIELGADPLTKDRNGQDAIELLLHARYSNFVPAQKVKAELYRCYAPNRPTNSVNTR